MSYIFRLCVSNETVTHQNQTGRLYLVLTSLNVKGRYCLTLADIFQGISANLKYRTAMSRPWNQKLSELVFLFLWGMASHFAGVFSCCQWDCWLFECQESVALTLSSSLTAVMLQAKRWKLSGKGSARLGKKKCVFVKGREAPHIFFLLNDKHYNYM